MHNNISANFSKFRLQNFKSSSAYNWQRETKRKAGFSFWNERTDYTKYFTYKHRRFLNFLLTKFEKIISKAYFAKGLMKKLLFTSFLLILMAAGNCLAAAENNLSQKLSGRILLQVQLHGEAWYVNPVDQKRYSLGRPNETLAVMKQLSIGITNSDLNKIPLGPFTTDRADDDQDGLPNNTEIALGTNPNSQDSDNDGYNDALEIANGYNPLGSGRLPLDINFTKKHLGKIFLQVESRGEAWYVNPTDQKRYFLGSPADAFVIMKNLGLGITNSDLAEITIGYIKQTSTVSVDKQPNEILSSAAQAIRTGETEKALTYFTPTLHKAIEYTMNFLDAEGKLTLANILSGSSLNSSTTDEKIYKNEVYFSLGGYNVLLYFHIQKQPDGTWLIANL